MATCETAGWQPALLLGLLLFLWPGTASAQTVNERPLLVFDTVADLVARGNPRTVRDVVMVLGWTNAWDGGATMFKATNTVTATNTTTRIFSGVTTGGGWSWEKLLELGDVDLQAALNAIAEDEGSLLFRDASGWTNLPPDTSGYFLMTQGAGQPPVWAAAPGAGGGESNDGDNLGEGYPLFAGKVGTTLTLNTISNTAPITLSSNANVLTIAPAPRADWLGYLSVPEFDTHLPSAAAPFVGYDDGVGRMSFYNPPDFRHQIKAATYYATIAEMLAADVPVGPQAHLATVGGYHDEGIGGGVFYYDPLSTADTNTGSVFAASGAAGRWLAVDQDRVNVLRFGARADGSTDDTAVFDAAYDYAKASGRMLYVPKRTYRLSNWQLDEEGVWIYCDNPIFEAAATNAPVIHIVKSRNIINGNFTVDGLGLADVDGILMGAGGFGVEQCELSGFEIEDCRNGLYLHATTNNVIINRFFSPRIRRCDNNVYLHTSVGSNNRANNNQFFGLSSQNCNTNGAAFRLNGADGNSIFGYEAEINNGPAIKINDALGLKIVGAWLEDNLYTYYEDGPASGISGIYIQGVAQNFTSSDTTVVMDRSIDITRTVQIDLHTTSISFGVTRFGGELRIGEDGIVAHNQGEANRLTLSGGMFNYQHSTNFPRFLIRGDADLGGWQWWMDGVVKADLTSSNFTVGASAEFSASTNGNVVATKVTTPEAIATRVVATRFDRAGVVVLSSGTSFTFDFPTSSRYRITELTANSTFVVDNLTTSDTVENEIWVDVETGGGYTLTTSDPEVEWIGTEAIPLGDNARLRLRVVNLVCYAEWLNGDTSIHEDVAGEITAISEKATPVGNDELLLEDSEDGFNKKSAKVSSLATALGATSLLTATEGNSAYQPLDGDLTTIAGQTGTGIAARTGATTWALRTITGDSEITVSNGDGVSGNPTLAIASSLARDAEVAAAYQPIFTTGTGVTNTANVLSANITPGSNITFTTNANGAIEIASSGLSDGDKGDVTVSGSGATWTIDNGVVSSAKMANMAQGTVKGRAAGAGTGAPSDLDGAAIRAITGIPNWQTDDPGASAIYPSWDDGTGEMVFSATIPANDIAFSDPGGNFTATEVDGAIDELVAVNGSGPNASDAKVDWSQLANVPAGFADGTDASGNITVQEEGSSLTQRAIVNFIGGGVTAVDNSGSSRSDVTITRTGVKRTWYVNAGAMRGYTDGPSGPALAIAKTYGTTIERDAWEFADSLREGVYFEFDLPPTYDGGTVKIRFKHSAPATGNADLEIYMSAIADGDAISALEPVTEHDLVTAVSTADDEEWSAAETITIDGTAAAGDTVGCYIIRDSNGVSDTITGVWYLFSASIEIGESSTEPTAW